MKTETTPNYHFSVFMRKKTEVRIWYRCKAMGQSNQVHQRSKYRFLNSIMLFQYDMT